jgi:tetratricopeptide (TPR) repeat protein
MGNIPAAESHYQLAASIEPQKTTYWNSLANYYIRYEIEIKEKGAAAARQAVILAPEDPVSLDILAQIYLLQDNPIIAERFLMRALTADEEYAPAHLHFGLVCIIEGDLLGAFQHFSAAVSFSQPDNPTYDQARRLLETYFP